MARPNETRLRRHKAAGGPIAMTYCDLVRKRGSSEASSLAAKSHRRERLPAITDSNTRALDGSNVGQASACRIDLGGALSREILDSTLPSLDNGLVNSTSIRLHNFNSRDEK